MNYARMRELQAKGLTTNLPLATPKRHLKMVQGGGFEPPKLSRQIYSLIPLATREPLLKAVCILYIDRRNVNTFSLNFTDLAAKLKVTPQRQKMELARGVEPPTG